MPNSMPRIEAISSITTRGRFAHHNRRQVRICLYGAGDEGDISFQFFFRISLSGNGVGDSLGDMGDHPMDNVGIEAVLVADLIIDSGFVDAGTRGNVINMRSVVSLLGKYCSGGG